MIDMIAQMSGTEAGVVGIALALVGAILARQWQRDKATDSRMAKVLEENDRYARDLAGQTQTLLLNNTKAMIGLTEALKDRPCLVGDSRANLMKGKEVQP
jgi:uncharacterized membrane protein YccC